MRPCSGILEGELCLTLEDPPRFSVRTKDAELIEVYCDVDAMIDLKVHSGSSLRVWFKYGMDDVRTAIRLEFLPAHEPSSMKRIASRVARRWGRALRLLGE